MSRNGFSLDGEFDAEFTDETKSLKPVMKIEEGDDNSDLNATMLKAIKDIKLREDNES